MTTGPKTGARGGVRGGEDALQRPDRAPPARPPAHEAAPHRGGKPIPCANPLCDPSRGPLIRVTREQRHRG